MCLELKNLRPQLYYSNESFLFNPLLTILERYIQHPKPLKDVLLDLVEV